MTLAHLFTKCLRAPYVTARHSADLYVEKQGSTLYLFFQCSNGAEDWMNNLDFPVRALRTPSGRCYFAHRGFVRVFEAVLPRIREAASDKAVREAVTVGYSHGAALAVLCHGFLWQTYPLLRAHLKGYGFGCPRVLWGRLPREVSWDTFTVIRNLNDVVTHVPPALLGYRHVGKLLEIGERGKYSPVDAHRPENILRELISYGTSVPFCASLIEKCAMITEKSPKSIDIFTEKYYNEDTTLSHLKGSMNHEKEHPYSRTSVGLHVGGPAVDRLR